MSFLLDTNICSAFVRQPGTLAHRFVQHAGRLSIPTIALDELYTWAYRRSNASPLVDSIRSQLLQEVTVLDFTSECALRFGQVRSKLLAAGKSIDQVDLMIAAVALEHDLTVVTHNTRHFEPVPGLRVEDWLHA